MNKSFQSKESRHVLHFLSVGPTRIRSFVEGTLPCRHPCILFITLMLRRMFNLAGVSVGHPSVVCGADHIVVDSVRCVDGVAEGVGRDVQCNISQNCGTADSTCTRNQSPTF